MIIDMPLPMPRWLISSPIHISTAVPATSVRMIEVAARPDAVGQQLDVRARWLAPRESVAAAGAEDERQAGGLQRGDADRQVAGVLGDLALADRALSAAASRSLGMTTPRTCMMMLAVMYGMIPSAKIEKLSKRAAGEQVEEAERALRLDALLELLDRPGVDARHADGDAEPVEGDHRQREQDLVPQIRDLEDVLQVGEHARRSSVTARDQDWVRSAVGELVALDRRTARA